MSNKATLEEWTDRFGIVGSSEEALSEDTLKDTAALKEMARNFKTPLKASQEPTDEEVAEMVNLVETTEVYKRKITTPADMEKLTRPDATSFLTEVIHRMEEKLEEVSCKSVIWEAVSEQVTKRIQLELLISFSKTGNLEATIGKRVNNEMPGSEAPMAWSSMASLTTVIMRLSPKFKTTWPCLLS
jgi:hypothetical protein